MSGIIHSIMRLVDACRGSAAGMEVIFCTRYMDAPTRMGSNGMGSPGTGPVVSGSARSIHRKVLFSGMISWTWGSHE